MRCTLMLVLLVGCAGVQGIPMAPPPPVFNPVEDAPLTVGHPDAPQRVVEPNPQPSRQLPESPDTRREPGIWASGDHGPIPTVRLLSVDLPFDAEEKVLGPVNQCAKHVDGVVAATPNIAAMVNAMARDRRTCLAALLLVECLHFRQGEHADQLLKREANGEVVLKRDTALQALLVSLAAKSLSLAALACAHDDVADGASRAAKLISPHMYSWAPGAGVQQ